MPKSPSTNVYKKDSGTQHVPCAKTSQVTNTKEQPKPLLKQPKESSVDKLRNTNTIKPTDRIKPDPMMEHIEPSEQKFSPKTTSDDVNVNKTIANVEEINKTKKVNSWASNYLYSIGHNKKPIKMNLSLNRNKKETISTNNDLNKPVAQSTLNKVTEPSSYDVFNTTDSYRKFNELNNNTVENINMGNIKSLYPPTIPTTNPDLHLEVTPVAAKSNIPAPANSTILVDTIYSSNSNSKVPAYATLLAKTEDEAIYCYNDGNRETDIFDAIKSKINRENEIVQKSLMMNLPSHKDMCENFIKEISIKKSAAFEKKSDRSKSSPPAKSKEASLIKKKSSTSKPDSKVVKNSTTKSSAFEKKSDRSKSSPPAKSTEESLIKKNSSTPKPESKEVKNKIKELSKSIKKIDKELLKKSKLSSTEKDAQKKKYQDYQRYKKQENSKPIIDSKDFDHLSNKIFQTNRQPAMEVHSPERSNLKRARTCSENRLYPSSEILNTSPMRSVVKVADNNYESNSPKRKCFEERFDLRSKLSRVNQRINQKKIQIDLNKKPTQWENLKIAVENHNDEKHKSPKKSSVLKYKTNKCKKLKLIINVVCQESDDETTSSDSSISETENNPTHHMDLSFLDDFNVDEIVDSLKHSPKRKIISPLSHEIKSGNYNKIPVEPELKLATILSMLNVKSETNNNFTTSASTSVKTECKSEETEEINRATLSNINLGPEMSSTFKKEDNIGITENTWHLVKIACQTKNQLHQQNTAVSEECNIGVHINHEQHSGDKNKLVIDESVIINEQEISIIDLTNDLTNQNVCAATNTKNITADVVATPNNIQQETQSNAKKKEDKTVKWNQRKMAGNNIVNQLEPITPTTRTKDIHYQNETGKSEKTTIMIERKILNQNLDSVIDLTNDTIDDETISKNMAKISAPVDKENNAEDVTENIKYTTNTETVKQKNTNNQIEIESNIFVNKDIHLIPKPEKNDNVSNENEKAVVTKIQTINENRNNLNTATQLEIKKPIEMDETISSMNGLIHSNNLTKSDKERVQTPAYQLTKHVPDTSMTSKDNVPSGIKSLTDIFHTDVTGNVIEKTVEIVWDTKNENGKVSQANGDNIEIGIASKGNINEYKSTNEISENENKELITTNRETVKIPKPPAAYQIIINNENIKNVSPSTNTALTDVAPNNNKDFNKIFESKTAKEVLDKIVATVWDTKNELENTSKTNGAKDEIVKPQTNDTKTEIGNASKTSTIENKVINNCGIGYQYRALGALLEERLKDYSIKNIKIIKHIRQGKYSNVFSCKDSNGQTYAVKMLKSDTNRQVLGIEKDQMIKRLQKDVPRENLNTVFLIDSFGIERYWCFLTEFYPKNLQEVLQKCKRFHIDRVQRLASQLISAVMLLRNHNVVHSDIKPSHILLDYTHERLKLCGFDSAYYKNKTVLLPNIGTSYYRAPEIILGFSAGHSIDVWSSALVIYEMATKYHLIDGIYNNDVLYRQMCIFGSFPRDMVEMSMYKARYFQGQKFMRRLGSRGQDIKYYGNFYRTKRIEKGLWNAFKNLWPGNRRIEEKLMNMASLLEQMLLPDPRQRLQIKFACVDHFIYEMW